jgi:hypothetical protein
MVTNQYGEIHAGSLNTVAADVAERFPIKDTSIEAGDVVSISDEIAGNSDTLRVSAYLKKADRPYDPRAVGVVSTEPGIELGKEEFQNQVTRPVGIVGRVPVKVTNKGGRIKPGDFLTTSGTPGYAMKASRSGMVIGRSLDYFDSTQGSIMVFLDPGYQQLDWKIEIFDQMDGDGIQGSSTPATYIIDQKGGSDLLQLQQNGADRFLVRNDGSVEVNVNNLDTDIQPLLVIKNNDSEVFTINARGDVETKGVLRIKNDSFAGSISINEQGLAEVNFDYPLGTGKPSIQLTVEDDSKDLILAKIISLFQDEERNYTGFRIKAAKVPSGAPAASSTVHYFVVAKQEGYLTASATPITVSDDSSEPVQISVLEEPEGEPVVTVTSDQGQVTSDTEPPIIEIQGNNPAYIDVGSQYTDLGVLVTDNVDQNLGYKIGLNGGPEIYPNELQLDTSTSTEYELIYRAVDQAGNLGTAIRRVIVGAGSIGQPEPVPEPTPEPIPEPTPVSEPLVVSNAEPEASSTPAEVAQPEPTPEPPAASAESSGEPQPEPTPEPAPTPTPEPPPAEQPTP